MQIEKAIQNTFKIIIKEDQTSHFLKHHNELNRKSSFETEKIYQICVN